MAGDWFYSHGDERHGPVSWERLRKLARDGWLHPAAEVWQGGSAPRPATAIDGLFPLSVDTVFQQAIGQRPPTPSPPPLPATPPVRSHRRRRRRRRRPRPVEETLPFGWQARHVVAAGGGLLAALGVAFLFIDPTPLALVFLFGGLLLLAAGLVVELRRLLGDSTRHRVPPPADGARTPSPRGPRSARR